MSYNLLSPALIILVYLPIYLLSISSKTFKQKFMKVHSQTKKQYTIEILAGLMYFAIIITSIYTKAVPNKIHVLIGLSIYIISIIITYTGYITFIRTPKNKLSKKFPYNFSRNPTYFFGLTAILGITIITKSNLLITLLAIQFILTHRIIITEEKYLTKTYKKEYTKYKKNVRRYF